MTREINGTFEKVNGGYVRRISADTTEFIPDMCAASFDESTGTVSMYCPDYEALEKAKAPAVSAKDPGEYAYQTEVQREPIGCDFSAELAYYGKHYYLRPLRDGIPDLKGRGITKERDCYCVTAKAYEKLNEIYKISYEMCFD